MGSSPENNPAAPPSAPANPPVDEPASYNPSTKSPSELENGHGVPTSAGGKGTELRDAKVADSTSIHAGDGTIAGNDLLAGEETNAILARKMHLLNDAIDQIGWTNFHLKLFFLSGFGYAVDSMVTLLQSVIAAQAYREIAELKGGGYPTGLTIASYTGLLVGSLFWGITADMIGRRIAFNVTLFLAAGATIVAGASPTWASLGFFIFLISFGGGGNLVLDPTVYLEYLPSDKAWTITTMACWWGIGQAFTGFVAWGFLPQEQWNCSVAEECTWDNNKGWRLVMFTSGALVGVLAALRIFIVRLKETPKYLIGKGRDEDLVRTLQDLATRYNRPCDLTVEQLTAIGEVRVQPTTGKQILRDHGQHFSGLFATKKLGLSTSMVWLSWTLIGLAYPMFYVFLPAIISSRVPDEPESDYITWRNYTLTNVSGIVGPLIAGSLANVRVIGRKYTMVIGALLTMAFFFGYTAITTTTQNVVFSCVIACCVNIYYGTLYAYTAEVFPSAHRATGTGIAVACGRTMGILSAVIAAEAGTDTVAPLYICAGLFVVMAIVSASFPFEPYGQRSS